MFLWSIALQYLIYTICILLIDHHIRYKYLFAGVILISCILIGWVYSILGIFTALCQMMLVKRNLRIIWTEQKEENLFLFCLFG
ncbi:hypothetical protein I5T53_13310 [Enterococcus faecium]|nr:hypothetical protein [Enterococcus faecium]